MTDRTRNISHNPRRGIINIISIRRVVVVILMMMSLRSRTLHGWIIHRRHHHTARHNHRRRPRHWPVIRRERSDPQGRPFSSSSRGGTTTTVMRGAASASESSWKAGDAVWLRHDDDEGRTPAVIREFRGRGWYALRLLDDDDGGAVVVRKARGTRLEPRHEGGEEGETSTVRDGGGDGTADQGAPSTSAEEDSSSSTAAASWQDGIPVVNSTMMFRGLDVLSPDASKAEKQTTTTTKTTATAKTTTFDPPKTTTEDDNLPLVDATDMFRRSSSSNTTRESAVVDVAPPPPTVIDLDAVVRDDADPSLDGDYLRRATTPHARTRRWVVFTDLHVRPSALTTCLRVLDFVHDAAVTRRAGIVFLGDFWHQRGTLRVDCLHAVLQTLSEWKVPMIMIPGNHDQVTLGGHLHGLTALRNAYRVGDAPGPLIFSHPTVFRRALWIPHIREHAVMESVLQSSAATTTTTTTTDDDDDGGIRAVMCHADVTGAYMNDLLVSTGGVPPRWFPSGIPVYSGHFHKPHTVEHKSKSIEYLGSPYQVSLSEAHQNKALAVMDERWRVVERIPIRLGRFHFRPSTVEEFLELRHAASRHHDDTVCCAGDRVVCNVDKLALERMRREADDGVAAVDAHAKRLQKAGVAVEIREVPHTADVSGTQNATGHDGLEELSPESTWNAFLESQVERGALSEAKAEELHKAGLEILESVQDSSSTDDAETAPVDAKSNTGSRLGFHSMTVEGFGPFDAAVEYPLDSRGLVLVRGTNQDDGSDSNGTGKSTLAMSPLWALTGALDPRPLPDGKVADVVNDDSKVARVTLRGTCNGKEFTIVRSKTEKRGGLTFVHDGEDLTTQSARETQLVIDEVLGISSTILARSVFFGQHPLNELLDSTDTRFKEELSLLVPLSTWQEVLAASRKRARACEKRINELQGMLSIRKDDLSKIVLRADSANKTYQQAAEEFRGKEESLSAELERDAEQTGTNTTDWIKEAEDKVKELSLSIQKLEAEREPYESDRRKAEERLLPELNKFKDQLRGAEEDLKTRQRVLDVAQVQYQNSIKTLEKLEADWQLDLRAGASSELRLPDKCPTCGQPLSEDSSAHAHLNFQEAVDSAWENRRSTEQQVKGALDALKEAEAFHAKRAASLANMEDTRSETLSWLDKQIDKVNQEIRQAWQQREQYTVDLAAATRKRQEWIEAKSVREKLDAERDALARLEATAATITAERQEYEETIHDLEAEQKKNSEDMDLMKDLAASFGQRGIQVFVLRNALEALQAVSQSYLDDMSDSTLELRLFLEDGDRIVRQVGVSSGTEKSDRSLASLSGGQWRRCSLALQLGFADLLSRRGKFESSLLVFDEPLTHLDQSGRSSFGRVLSRLLQYDRSTILLILQDLAAEELAETFDAIDEVVRLRGRSSVNVDKGTAE